MFRFIISLLVIAGIAILSPEREKRSSTDVVHEVSRVATDARASASADLARKSATEMIAARPLVRAAYDRVAKAALGTDRPLEMPPLRR